MSVWGHQLFLSARRQSEDVANKFATSGHARRVKYPAHWGVLAKKKPGQAPPALLWGIWLTERQEIIMENCKLLLFDLDGTLLRSDKTISKRTLRALQKCRERGILAGVSTSRSEQNALSFIDELKPEILITSGGALVKYNGSYIYKAMFSAEETKQIIQEARDICGAGCEITADTLDAHYWNYKTDPKKIRAGETAFIQTLTVLKKVH